MNQKDRNRKIFWASAIALGIAALTVVGIIGFFPWQSASEPISTTQSPTQTAQPKNEYVGTTHKPWSELLTENSDIIGWLTIGGTKCDNPIMLGQDNDYYLKHSFEKNPSRAGTLFLDYRCWVTPEAMSPNLTVYGHNMANGSMFGQLKRYKKVSFYQEHPIIQFDTLYGKYEWKVFAVFITNANDSDGEIFDYRQPSYYRLSEFAARCKARSLIRCPVDVKDDDTVLTLSTCTYELNNARFVVMARMTRDYEEMGVDVSQATVNPNPLYPDGWYRRYGGTKPEDPITSPIPTLVTPTLRETVNVETTKKE